MSDERSFDAVCDSCGAPVRRVIIRVPQEAGASFPLGPNRGVLIARCVPGTSEWITAEYRPPDDDHDDFEVIEPLVSFKLACIILGATPATLYAHAASLASSRKVFERWKFKTRVLYDVDLGEEQPLPTRAEQLADRDRRRASGEVLRSGPHVDGCSRGHSGKCVKARRRRRPSERERVARSIRDDLGK